MSVPLLQQPPSPLIDLRLSRDLTRTIKRGHPWVFADSLRNRPDVPPGTHARLLDKRGREIARGFYDPQSPLAFRVCTLEPGQKLNDTWAKRRLWPALELRQRLFDEQTTGYRLLNGEGDGLPGLVCDIYGDTAVIQCDGEAATQFWHAMGLAHWVAEMLALPYVYERQRTQPGRTGRPLIGKRPPEVVSFLENGTRFTADVVQGQKTGFFFD